MFINSNDPLQPQLSVPVTLSVEPTADMGQVAGSVRDAWTGYSLNATVDMEGVYSMPATPGYSIWAVEGIYSLTAYAAGYNTLTLQVEISAGDTTTQDIALEPSQPRLGWLPDEINVIVIEGSIGTQELKLFNDGPQPLDFSLHEVGPFKSVDKANTLTGMRILYDQTHCQDDLTYYNELTADLASAGATIYENFRPFDETTLLGYDVLWLNDGDCPWTVPELAILIDWLAGGGGVLIQSSDTLAVIGPAGIFGITYQEGFCAYGGTQHINAHPISAGVETYFMNWTCNYIFGNPGVVVLDPWYMNPHVIATEQGSGRMVVVAGSDFIDGFYGTYDTELLAMNSFHWLGMKAYGDYFWLSESPEEGSIPDHSNLSAILTFDATALPQGIFQAVLAIEHNDPDQFSPVEIPVTLVVDAPYQTYLPMVFK